MRKVLSTVLLVILFLGSCYGLHMLIFWDSDRRFRDPVGGVLPPEFPVLVITRGEDRKGPSARVVYHKDLPGFIRQHPQYSYLVPPGLDEALNQELKQNSRSEKSPPDFDPNSPLPWAASFKVERFPGGWQSLEVEGTWDDDRPNVGFYEATEKEILPKYYKSYRGPSVAMSAALLALVVNSLAWAIGAFLYGRWKRKKSRQAAAGSPPGTRS